jgi:hypothetical protein
VATHKGKLTASRLVITFVPTTGRKRSSRLAADFGTRLLTAAVLFAARRTARERGGPLPSITVADTLLDERKRSYPTLNRCYADFVIDIDCQRFRKDALYHYTDFTALKSIYEKGEIWATSSQYLNDISEMKLGPKAIMGVFFKPLTSNIEALPELTSQANIMRERIESDSEGLRAKLKRIKAASDEQSVADLEADEDIQTLLAVISDFGTFFDSLKPITDMKELIPEIGDALKYALEDTTCFIFSLSKEPDQLSQWRGYAKDGVCIQFSAKALCASLRSAPAVRARMRSVKYYDENETAKESNRMESYARPIINWAGERSAQLIADGVDAATRKMTIGQELTTQLAFVKDIHFKEENEVRIAVQGDPNHFMPQRYGIVPKMKLAITADAIKSVIVGPTAFPELRVQSLRTFFDHTGFKNDPDNKGDKIEVSQSSIPYRDW